MMFLTIPIAYSSTNSGSYWGGGFGPKANFCKPKPRGRGFNIHYKLLIRYTVVICHGWNLPDKHIYCINDQNLLKNCMLGLWNTLFINGLCCIENFVDLMYGWSLNALASIACPLWSPLTPSVRPRFFISLLTAADMAFWHADPQRFAHGWNKMAKGLGIRFYERLEPWNTLNI